MFTAGLLISHVLAGTYFGSDESSVYNTLTVIRMYNVADLFTIPWLNFDFFTVGLPRLIDWDYSFFGGEAEIIRYFLYAISMGIVFGLLPIVVGALSWALRR